MEEDELNVNMPSKADTPSTVPSTALSSDVETTPGPSTPAELVPEGSLNREKTPETGQAAIADDANNDHINETTIGHYGVVFGGFCGMFASFGWRAGMYSHLRVVVSLSLMRICSRIWVLSGILPAGSIARLQFFDYCLDQ